MSCYGEVRRGGDRKRDRQEALQSTIVIEAIPRYPPQRVLGAGVIPRGGPGRASLNFHTKRDATWGEIRDYAAAHERNVSGLMLATLRNAGLWQLNQTSPY